MLPIRCAVVSLALASLAAGAALAQAAPRRPAAPTPHATAGKTDCLSCHAQGANQHITNVPAAHRFANETCLMCHRLAQTMPPSSQHAMDAAHTRCAVCHVAGSPTHAKAPPASHAAYHASTCSLCHQAAPR